jgi:transcriptional regulator with XRE-family HTH domain
VTDVLQRLDRAIAARGKSRWQIGKKAGLSSGYMTWLFKDPSREPTRATLELLAEALQVPLGWLSLGLEPLPDFMQEQPKKRKAASR